MRDQLREGSWRRGRSWETKPGWGELCDRAFDHEFRVDERSWETNSERNVDEGVGHERPNRVGVSYVIEHSNREELSRRQTYKDTQSAQNIVSDGNKQLCVVKFDITWYIWILSIIYQSNFVYIIHALLWCHVLDYGLSHYSNGNFFVLLCRLGRLCSIEYYDTYSKCFVFCNRSRRRSLPSQRWQLWVEFQVLADTFLICNVTLQNPKVRSHFLLHNLEISSHQTAEDHVRFLDVCVCEIK